MATRQKNMHNSRHYEFYIIPNLCNRYFLCIRFGLPSVPVWQRHVSGFADTRAPTQHGVNNTTNQHQGETGCGRPINVKHFKFRFPSFSIQDTAIPAFALGSELRKQPAFAAQIWSAILCNQEEAACEGLPSTERLSNDCLDAKKLLWNVPI